MTRRRLLQAAPLAAAAGARVNRWSVITIGNLSRNRYWGEPDTKPLRAAICTCTLVSGEGFHLLVDPSLAVKEDMARELDRRTGLKPDDITAVFITHEHGDHFAGLDHFPRARRYAAAPVVAALAGRKKLEPAPPVLFGAVRVVPTPGHTRSHHSLVFACEGKRVAIAGDAVATADFWRERRSYYNAIDPADAARSMDQLAAAADVMIPGHDNYFLL